MADSKVAACSKAEGVARKASCKGHTEDLPQNTNHMDNSARTVVDMMNTSLTGYRFHMGKSGRTARTERSCHTEKAASRMVKNRVVDRLAGMVHYNE